MQRRKSSRIVSSDFPTLGGRNQGTYILQSHGTNVSRGDLITQDNIIPDPYESQIFTITIDKDTYASLCQQATSWAQVGLPETFVIGGAIATDDDGIYASTYGSGSSWHGPVFYATLPTEIGKSGQYWHATFKVSATFVSGTLIYSYVRIGFSTYMQYFDPYSGNSDGVTIRSVFYNTSAESLNNELQAHDTVGSTNTYTFKFYHYQNNTFKTYINGTLYKNQSDPFVLDKGSNIAACYISQGSAYTVPYFRVQEITVSTDPTYDPQP